jgi:hypothetical protein
VSARGAEVGKVVLGDAEAGDTAIAASAVDADAETLAGLGVAGAPAGDHEC